MNPEVTDLLQTGLRERDEAENEPLLDSDNDDSDEDEENENDYIDSGDRDELRVVILAFINDEEEVERLVITHSGRTNNTIAINMPSVLTTSVIHMSLPERLYRR